MRTSQPRRCPLLHALNHKFCTRVIQTTPNTRLSVEHWLRRLHVPSCGLHFSIRYYLRTTPVSSDALGPTSCRGHEQASTSAQQQVRLGASDVGVRGLSVVRDSGVVNSHVLTFRCDILQGRCDRSFCVRVCRQTSPVHPSHQSAPPPCRVGLSACERSVGVGCVACSARDSV